MSDDQTSPEEEKEGQPSPDQTKADAAKSASDKPMGDEAAKAAEPAAEKPPEKPKTPRKRTPKATAEKLGGEAGEKPAPKPAAKKPEKAPMKPAAPPPEERAEKRSIFREPVVLWSVIGGVVVILLAAGYVAWNQFGPHGARTASNPLSERSICQATLDKATSYGVIPPTSALASPDPDKTQIDGRVTCHGQSGEAKFAMTVDVVCDDMGKDSCLKLYSVKQNDGAALFQRQ
jgi:hypothetical protein